MWYICQVLPGIKYYFTLFVDLISLNFNVYCTQKGEGALEYFYGSVVMYESVQLHGYTKVSEEYICWPALYYLFTIH